MAVYQHYQEVKKTHALPMAEQVGACLTCNWWDETAPRPAEEKDMVGLCVQPTLKGFALIVSGSSACNKWEKYPNAGQEAQDYSLHGDAAA